MKKTVETIIRILGYGTLALLFAGLVLCIFEKKAIGVPLAISGAGTAFLFIVTGVLFWLFDPKSDIA